MHVAEFLDAFAFRPHVEIVEGEAQRAISLPPTLREKPRRMATHFIVVSAEGCAATRKNPRSSEA